MKYLLATALFALYFVVTACNGKYSSIDSKDLRNRAYQCDIETDMSTADIQVCKNIKRECLRRQDEGQFDC